MLIVDIVKEKDILGVGKFILLLLLLLLLFIIYYYYLLFINLLIFCLCIISV